jgi:hypothetical protein
MEFGMPKTVADQFAEMLAAVSAPNGFVSIVGDNLNGFGDAIVR